MHNNKGFTLLEILIALFIFTIISIIMATGLHTVLNSQAATTKKAERIANLQMTFIILSRDIEQVVNRAVANGKGTLENPVVGTRDTLALTHAGLANPFGQLPRSTLQRSNYFLEKNNFIRENWPALDLTAKTLTDQRTWLTSVQTVQFEYLDDEGNFQSHWPLLEQKSKILPKAIRVTLTIENSGKVSQLFIIPAQVLTSEGTPNK